LAREGLIGQPIGKPRLVASIRELRGKKHERQAEHRREQRNVDRHQIRQGEDEQQNPEAAVAKGIAQCAEGNAWPSLAREKFSEQL